MTGQPAPQGADEPRREDSYVEELDTAAIALMREQGTLPVFMRSRISRPDKTRTSARRPSAANQAGHRPGAWPSVTTPAGPGTAPRPVSCSCALCRALAEHVETDRCRCALCTRRLVSAARRRDVRLARRVRRLRKLIASPAGP
ncbi:hypothetical protein [Streptomyces sp. NBC_00470]|uniref:hypothetical protein n=1 Tax=Streptomyces sp. NBC_00470 TaxID=2975753 RepID=UPI002F90766E